jgi:hypothetical protein
MAGMRSEQSNGQLIDYKEVIVSDWLTSEERGNQKIEARPN